MKNCKIDWNKIREAQGAKGYTDTRLAQETGIAISTIQRIKKGKKCYEFTAVLLARALEVPLVNLIEEAE